MDSFLSVKLSDWVAPLLKEDFLTQFFKASDFCGKIP